jgi:hypothetical protein
VPDQNVAANDARLLSETLRKLDFPLVGGLALIDLKKSSHARPKNLVASP